MHVLRSVRRCRMNMPEQIVGTEFNPMACGPHGPPPAPMPRSRASPGSDARHRSSDVILGFAEYASSFPYIFACLSLSLLFRQSLLYDSQFNISIRTRLISTQIAAVRIGSPGGLLERKESTKLSSYPAPAV